MRPTHSIESREVLPTSSSLNLGYRHITVPVVTLDDFAVKQQLGRVDLIKMDTKRTEHEVLAGARKILEKFPRLHPHPPLCFPHWRI